MEDQNLLIFVDKIKKLLELGNTPKAINELDGVIIILSRVIAKKKGKLFEIITIPQATETELANPIFMRDFEIANKLNEVITFLNGRFENY